MKVRGLSRRVLMAGLAVAVSGLLVLSRPSPGSAVTFSNACINSAVPTAAAQLNVTLTANAPASVQPGASLQLTNISQTVDLPGTVFVAGYNLGLLVVGNNTVPGTSKMVIEGTNTVQGTQTTPVTAVSLTFTITDPDGIPGTGDETATNATAAASYPDQTWTAGPAGAIEFREDTPTPLSTTVGGIVVTATIGGFLTVRFGCDPGTVGVGGTPADITLTDPAPSFASTISVALAQGDVDCSIGNVVNSVDALKVLRFSAGLEVNQVEPCPDIGTVFLSDKLFGDVDCSGSVNAVDALKILRFAAGLPVQQIGPEPDSCVDIGEEFAVEK